jgi:serine/threonine-protein kinase RsbW
MFCPEEPQQPALVFERIHQVHALPEMKAVLDLFLGELAAAGYSEKDLFSVRLVLEEAIVNAIRHGNKGDIRKHVRISYTVTPEHVLAEVEDEGTGFDPHQVPDPLAPENIDRPGGRGLFLMRHYTTWIRFNPRGNCVTLCRTRL